MTTIQSDPPAKGKLVEAARACLLETGYSGLSTRAVAQRAGVPLSQIHYHFGGKQGLVLAVLESQNQRLLERQTVMYAEHQPLWQRWEIACDFLDEDLDSGYVRVLQEMMAVGWNDAEVASAVRSLQAGWFSLLVSVVEDSELPLGPFKANELGALVMAVFLGAESMILEGHDDAAVPLRSALRKIGGLIRIAEQARSRGA